MLQSESWHENHEYAPLKGTIDEKKEQNKKIPNHTTHNSYINTRQEIAKKKCQSHWISSHSFNRFGPFQARSELQQENRTGSWDRV